MYPFFFWPQIRERDSRLASLSDENESLQNRVRTVKEDLAERDGQLKVAKMNLDTAHKQSQHHMQEVSLNTVSHAGGKHEDSITRRR